jgi:nitrate reductase (cytochrome), electron transfer subunit
MSNPVRKTVLMSVILASLLSLPAVAVEDQSISDDSLGLSKTSVFDIPDEAAVADFIGGDPGTNKRAVRSYMTAPPMITHSVNDMLPITRDSNLCKDCHVNPDLIGTKMTPGIPIPAPATHYVNVKKGQLYMGRWNCISCHRPQANVDLLVKSTFKKAK